MLNFKFWRRPIVKCVDCGFLARRPGGLDEFNNPYLENTFTQCHPDTRKELQSGKDYVVYSEDGDKWGVVACFHRVWFLWGYSGEKEAKIATAILNEGRRCPYCFSYRSGYEPAAHNELKRDQTNHRIMLVVGLINGAAVLIAALLTAILRR